MYRKFATLNTATPLHGQRPCGGEYLLAGLKINMARKHREFTEQFPLVSASFSTSAPTAQEWIEALDKGKGSRLLSAWMKADDLMTRVASHRESTDLFRMYGFASKRSLVSIELGITMKKHEQTTKSDNTRPEWKGFLDCRLDSNQLGELDEWKPKPVDVWEMVEKSIQDGYRFTLSYNKLTHVATCTIIDDNGTRKTAGYAIASGDTDGASALKMAVFKQHLLLQSDWSTLVDAPPFARRG